jgi:hypothetical protein
MACVSRARNLSPASEHGRCAQCADSALRTLPAQRASHMHACITPAWHWMVHLSLLQMPPPLQVLKALRDPRHPDLPAQLRMAAAAMTSQRRHGLRLWLEGGLLDALLGIVRTLPNGLGAREAAEVCAAAAAALGNAIALASLPGAELPAGESVNAMVAKVACCDVLLPLVCCGMLCQEAVEELPPERCVHVEVEGIACYPLVPPALEGWHDVRLSAQFWTPFRICAFTLLHHLLADEDRVTPELVPVLAALADEGVFRAAVTTASTYPCGKPSHSTYCHQGLM